MPNVVITLEMSEADAVKARKALCKEIGVEPPTTAAAKERLVELIKASVEREDRLNYKPITVTVT